MTFQESNQQKTVKDIVIEGNESERKCIVPQKKSKTLYQFKVSFNIENSNPNGKNHLSF